MPTADLTPAGAHLALHYVLGLETSPTAQTNSWTCHLFDASNATLASGTGYTAQTFTWAETSSGSGNYANVAAIDFTLDPGTVIGAIAVFGAAFTTTPLMFIELDTPFTVSAAGALEIPIGSLVINGSVATFVYT